MHGERETTRRCERLGAFINEPGIDQLVGDHTAQVFRRLGLHAGGDFFGEQFEEKIGHQAALPASVCTHASPQALASSRTRMM